MRETSKLLQFLGLCHRAGKLVMGFDAVVDSIKQGGAKVVLTTTDASPKTKKEINFFAHRHHVPYQQADFTAGQFEKFVKKPYATVAVTEESMAEKVLTLAKGEMQ